MPAAATPTVQIDNGRVRVTEWRFTAGAATGRHRHAHDYVVVPGTTGALRIVTVDGQESTAQLTAGLAYFRQAGAEHDVINPHSGDFVFVEIEIK